MQQRLQTTPERNTSIKVKQLINNCKPGRKCSGACLSRRSSSGDRGTLEVPQRPPRRLRALLVAAPRAAPQAPRVLRLGSRFVILYDAMCVSAYAIGASDEMNTMDMLECKVVNIIQEHILQAHVIYCILFYY